MQPDHKNLPPEQFDGEQCKVCYMENIYNSEEAAVKEQKHLQSSKEFFWSWKKDSYLVGHVRGYFKPKT